MASSISSFQLSSTPFKSQHLRRHSPLFPPPLLTSPSLRCWRRVFPSIHLSLVAFASSQPDFNPTEAEIEKEKNDEEQTSKESQEAWKKALESFKEDALKLQSVSQEAYQVYLEKAVVVLNETAAKLKIQADQARQDLSVIAEDLSKDGRQYLTAAAENSPESVKDVVDAFASVEDFDDVSKVRDFYVGVPYGTILSVGGFLDFMMTGSIPALRFGVILGGVLLALSVSSLRFWRNGKATNKLLKGQAGIAGILFLREIRLVFQGLTFVGLGKAIISGAVAAFFMYRIITDQPPPRTEIAGGVQN